MKIESNNNFTLIILVYRTFFALFCWTVLIIMMVVSARNHTTPLTAFTSSIGMYKYYTMQTNLLVALWLSLVVLFHRNPQTLNKIKGGLKGAITLYIIITFLVFVVMLRTSYHPTGINRFTNIASHYLIPLLMLCDWIILENNRKYNWLNLAFWLIYPTCYLIFAVSLGLITGNYLYPFLNINDLGLKTFFLSVSILILIFLFLGLLLLSTNRLYFNRTKDKDKISNKTEDSIIHSETIIEKS